MQPTAPSRRSFAVFAFILIALLCLPWARVQPIAAAPVAPPTATVEPSGDVTVRLGTLLVAHNDGSIGSGSPPTQTTTFSLLSMHPNHLEIFQRDASNNASHRWWLGVSGWYGAWESLGIALAGAPSVVSSSPDRHEVFIHKPDGAIHWQSWTRSGGRSAWQYMNGTTHNDIAVSSLEPNNLEMFIRGTRGKDRLDVFDLGLDGNFYQMWWEGAYQSPWQQVGSTASAPEVICDNKDACFSKYESGGVGSWGYIQPGTGDSSTTYNQHAFWTYNSQNQAIDWGKWQPSLPTTGTYDIYVWYPHYPGIVPETNTARYQVHDANGDRSFTWNQATNYGGWVKLTSASCIAGSSCYVRLTDETAEGTGTRRVWFDAVKFVLQAEPVFTVSGRILNNVGTGLAGVTVSDGTRTATTNSNGDYTLTNVPAGSYTLTPSLSGYTFSPTSLGVSVSSNVSGQNFTATQAADTTMPDGTITSPQSGQTITAGPITLTADAWDNPGGSGIARVEFKVYHTGNWREAGTVIQSPYTVRWNPPAGLAAQELRFAIHVIDHAGNRRIDPGGIRLVNYRPATPADGGFKLPYPAGASYMCSQGNNGAFSHTGDYKYAFDFNMSRGHTVVASRNGTVVAVKGDSTRGGCDQSYMPHANYVRIRHIDGTDTIYVHFDSVAVRVGEVVQRGQTIGRSGQTGYSCDAHLHVDRRNAGSKVTIPFSFLDVVGGVPRYGVWYTSGNHLGLASDTIAPIGTVRFNVNGQRPYQVQLLAEDDTTPLSALSMRLAASEAELMNAAWQPFAGMVDWDEPVVWVQFQDTAGNNSDRYADTLNPTATSPINAAFEVAPAVCEGAELTITNQTVPFCEQCQWQWDLGNGATSTEPEPISTRLSAGIQTISLNVANASSTSSASYQVTVLPAPTATFDLVRDGNTVTVTANNAGAISWAWDFGDGAVASGRVATHTYTNLPTNGEMPSIRLIVQGANSCTNESATIVSAIPATNHTVYLPLVRQ